MVDVKELFGLLAFAVSVCGVIELVQYLIIYRKPRFRQVKERMAVQSKKLGEMKTGGGGAAKSKNKKQERLENSMKMETGRLFTVMKVQQLLINMGTMFAAYKILAYCYGGKVVAKLPFEPWPFFQKITHRGLPGTDPTDAAMTLMFTLVQAGVKQTMAMWLQSGPSRAMQGLMQKNNELVQKKVAGL